MAPLVPFLYIDSIVDATLTGLNEQVHSMEINIIDSIISIVLVWFLLPVMGSYGYILMLYICKGINATLSFARLIKVTGFRMNFAKLFLKPALCIAVAVLAVKFVSDISGFSDTVNTVSVIIRITVSAAIYCVLIRLSECVNKEDCVWFGKLIKL